jgi:hypothetical protein
MTTSGLTHFYKKFRDEKKSVRVDELLAELMIGTISIHWETLDIELAICNAQRVATQTVSFAF